MVNLSRLNEEQDYFLGVDINYEKNVQTLQKTLKPGWSHITNTLIPIILVGSNVLCFSNKAGTGKGSVGDSNRSNHTLSSIEIIYYKSDINAKTLVHSKSVTNNKHQYYTHEMLSSAASSTESSGHTESSSKNSLNSSESVDTKLHRIYGTSNTYKTRREQSDNQTPKSINVKPVKSRFLANSQLGSYTRPIVPMERKSSLQEQSTANKDKIQIRKPKKDVRRAEIVASVTRRLYTNKKKPEPKTETEEVPAEQKDDDEEPEELKLCSRARAKLQELGRKAILGQRKLKPVMVDAECQTDFHLHVQRVKEKAVGTDLQSMDVSVGTDDSNCPPTVQRVREMGVGTDPPEMIAGSDQVMCPCNVQQTTDKNIELNLLNQQTMDKAIGTNNSCFAYHVRQLKEVVVAIDQNNSPGIFQRFKTVNCITDQHKPSYNLQGNEWMLLERDYHNKSCLLHKSKEVSMNTDYCEQYGSLPKYKEVAVGTDMCKHTCCCSSGTLLSGAHEHNMPQESTGVKEGTNHIQNSTDQSNSPSLLQSTKDVSVGTDQHNFTCHIQAKAVAVGTTTSHCSVGSDTRENYVHSVQDTRHLLSSNLIGDQRTEEEQHSCKTFKINQSESHHYIMRRSLGTETVSLEPWGSTNPPQGSGFISHSAGNSFGSLIQQYRPKVWSYFPNNTTQIENQRSAYQNSIIQKQIEECFSDDSLDSCHDIEFTTEVETDILYERPMRSFPKNNHRNIFQQSTEFVNKREPIRDNFRCNVHHNLQSVSNALQTNNTSMCSQNSCDSMQDIPTDMCTCKEFPLKVSGGIHSQENKIHHCREFHPSTNTKCECKHVKASSLVRPNDHMKNNQPFIEHHFVSTCECCKNLRHVHRTSLSGDRNVKDQLGSKYVPQSERLCSSCKISHNNTLYKKLMTPNPSESNNDRLLFTISEGNDQYESNDTTSHSFDRCLSPVVSGSLNHVSTDLQYYACNISRPTTPNVALSPDYHDIINMEVPVLRNSEDMPIHHIDSELQDPVSHNRIECEKSSAAETLNAMLCTSCNKCVSCSQQVQKTNTNFSPSTVHFPVSNNDTSGSRCTPVLDILSPTIESSVTSFTAKDRLSNLKPEDVAICPNNWPESSLKNPHTALYGCKPESVVSNKMDHPSITTSLGFPNRLQSEIQNCSGNNAPISDDHICDIHDSTYKVPDINVPNLSTRGESKSSHNPSKDPMAPTVVSGPNSEDKTNSNNNYCCSLNIPSIQISSCSSLEEHTKRHIQRIEKCIRKYYYRIMDAESSSDESSASSNSELPISHIFQTNITSLPKTLQLHRLDTLVIFDKSAAVKHSDKVPSKLINSSSNNKTSDEEFSIRSSKENILTDRNTESKCDDSHTLYKTECPVASALDHTPERADKTRSIECNSNDDVKGNPGGINLEESDENFEMQLLSTNVLSEFCDELVNVQPQLVLKGTYKSNSSTSFDSSITFLFKGQDDQGLLTDIAKNGITEHSFKGTHAEENKNSEEVKTPELAQDLNSAHNCSPHSKDSLLKKDMLPKYNSDSDCDHESLSVHITEEPLSNCLINADSNGKKTLQNRTHSPSSTGTSLKRACGYDNALKIQSGKTHNKHVSWSDLHGNGSLCFEETDPYNKMLSDSSTPDTSPAFNLENPKLYGINQCTNSSWLNEPHNKYASSCFDREISQTEDRTDFLPLHFPSEEYYNFNRDSKTSSGRDRTERLSDLTGASSRISGNNEPTYHEIKPFTISSSVPKKKNIKRKKRCAPLVSPLCRWNFMDVGGLATQGWGNGGALGTWFSLSAFIKKANALLKSLNEVSHMMGRKRNTVVSQTDNECDSFSPNTWQELSSTVYQSCHSSSQTPTTNTVNQYPKIKAQHSSELGLRIEQDLLEKVNNCKKKLDLRKEENAEVVVKDMYSNYDDETISLKLNQSSLNSSYSDNGYPHHYENTAEGMNPYIYQQEPTQHSHLRNTTHVDQIECNSYLSTRKKHDFIIDSNGANESVKPVTRPRFDWNNYVSRNLGKTLLGKSQLTEDLMLTKQETTNAHNISEKYSFGSSRNPSRTTYRQSKNDVPKLLDSSKNKMISNTLNTKLLNKQNTYSTEQNAVINTDIRKENSHSNITKTEILKSLELREFSSPYKVGLDENTSTSTNTNIFYSNNKEPHTLSNMQMPAGFGLRKELEDRTASGPQQPVLHSPNISESSVKCEVAFNQGSSKVEDHFIPFSIQKSTSLNSEYPHLHAMKNSYNVLHPSSKLEVVVDCANASNDDRYFLQCSSHLSKSAAKDSHSTHITRPSNYLQHQPQLTLCSSCNRNHRLPTVGSSWTSSLSAQEYDLKLPTPKVHRASAREALSKELVVPSQLHTPRISPRVYMQQLLQLRRQIVVASGFNVTRSSSSQHKQIKNS